MSDALVRAATPDDAELQRMFRIADQFAQSGMFKDVKQAGQAFVKMMLGRDIGLSPMQSMQGIDVVEGNIRMRGVMLLGFVRMSDRYDYRVLEADNEHAKLEFRMRVDDAWEVLGVEEFSIEAAKKAGIYRNHPKAAWVTWPRNMLIWKCASNGVKIHCPDLLGGVPVYTEADEFPNSADALGIGEGHGDGSDPGWGTVPMPLAHEIERVVRRAQRAGYNEIGSLKTVQLTLNQKPEDVILTWIRGQHEKIDEFKRSKANEAEVADAEVVSDAVS